MSSDLIRPYRPSNGTEGMMFMHYAGCRRCVHDVNGPENGCNLILRSLLGESLMEWSATLGDDGLGEFACSEFMEVDDE